MSTKWIQFTVAPESAATFEAELTKLVHASLAEEGCVQYAAYRDAKTPNIFTVLESWENEAAFEAHRNAPHVARFKETCGSVILEKSGQALTPVGLPQKGPGA